MVRWGDDEVSSSYGQPVPIGHMLDRVVRSLGAPGRSALEAVFSDWEELVGPQMAGHVRPLGIEDRILLLGVGDPAWASQVKWLGPELLSRLREIDPECGIEEVEIRVDKQRR